MTLNVIQNTITTVTNSLFFSNMKIYGFEGGISSISLNDQILTTAKFDLKEKVSYIYYIINQGLTSLLKPKMEKKSLT